jgi:hypothetical protein
LTPERRELAVGIIHCRHHGNRDGTESPTAPYKQATTATPYVDGGDRAGHRRRTDHPRADVRAAAAFVAELFSTELRYSGASMGYQIAGVLAGGIAASWRSRSPRRLAAQRPVAT